MGIGRRMAKGAAWTILMQFSIRSIGIVSMLILARLLIPEDFGLVAMATVVWALLEAVSDFNFEIPLIRESAPERRHYDTVWTLNIIKGVVVGVILAVIAIPSADFYEEPRLVPILYILAAAAFFTSFTNVGVTDFMRELQFHKDFVYNATRKFATTAITIPLAFILRDYWALVYGMVAGAVIQVVLSYVMHPFRPRPSLAVAREYFHFAKWLLLIGVLRFLTDNTDRMVLGKILGASPLGIYRMAIEISTLTSTQLTAPIHRALFPGFTKLANAGDDLGPHFLKTLQAVGALVIPVPLGIWATSEFLVPVMLGEKWLAAIPLIQVLGFYSLFRSAQGVYNPVLLALGKVRLQTVLQVNRLVFMVPGLLIGALYFGLEGAARGVALAMFCASIIGVTIVLRTLGLGWFDFWRSIWRSVLSCGAMVGLLYGLKTAWPTTTSVGEQSAVLFSMIALGIITYFSVHFALWRLSGSPESAEHHALSLARGALRRVRVRIPILSARDS